MGRVIEFDYNQLDQVTEERWKVGASTVRTLTHNYNAMGQLLASDPAATYAYEPDRLGRLKTETQTIAGFSPSFNIFYASTYNKAGSRESLKASLGTTPDFKNDYVYDHLQRLTSLTQQGQGGSGNTVAEKRIKFAYNAAGQFKTIGRYADASGTELVANSFYKYDFLGRLESMIHSEDPEAPTSGWGTAPLAGYIYLYDAASRLSQVNSLHVVDSTNVYENSTYAYDNTNQLTAADHDAQPDESYTYDANGNRISSGGVGYGVGWNNQLQSDGTYLYLYDKEGNRVSRTNGSGSTYDRYVYDHRNRLVSVEEVNLAHAPGEGYYTTWEMGGPLYPENENSLYAVAVQPAVEGDALVLMVGWLPGCCVEYYIEEVPGSAVEGVHFTDPNNTSASNWAPVPAVQDNGNYEFYIPTHYVAASTGSLTVLIHFRLGGEFYFTAQGVIYDREDLTIELVAYDYDIFNQLVHRAYDADGLVASAAPVTHTFFSWENGQIVFQFDGPASAVPSHRYLWNPLAIDQILADENSLNEVLWPLTDHLGTARDIAQHEAGETTIVNHRLYDSFGRLMSESDDGFTISFGFTGVYYEIYTGLGYHRARWYDPSTGRWLSEDPIGFMALDWNLYRSVGNNPVNYIDPSGLDEAQPQILGLEDADSSWQSLGGWNLWDIWGFRSVPNVLSGYSSAWWESLDWDNLQKSRERARALEAGDIGRYTRNMRLSPTQKQFCQGAVETNYNVMASGGPFGIAKSGVDDLLSGGPEHHLATNKNWVSEARGGPWSPRFQKIFEKAGMTLEDAANLVRVPGHVGPHPEAYHRAVFQRLTNAVKGYEGVAYNAALMRELDRIRKEVTTCGSELNKLVTGT